MRTRMRIMRMVPPPHPFTSWSVAPGGKCPESGHIDFDRLQLFNVESRGVKGTF